MNSYNVIMIALNRVEQKTMLQTTPTHTKTLDAVV